MAGYCYTIATGKDLLNLDLLFVFDLFNFGVPNDERPIAIEIDMTLSRKW